MEGAGVGLVAGIEAGGRGGRCLDMNGDGRTGAVALSPGGGRFNVVVGVYGICW